MTMYGCGRAPCFMDQAGYCVRCARPEPQPQPQVISIAPAMGCICPPGANLQCQNPNCPRKPMPNAGGVAMLSTADAR